MREAYSFEEILEKLHVDVLSQIAAIHDTIREAYTVRTYVVDSYQEFKNEILDYYYYHLNACNGAGIYAYQTVYGILNRVPDLNLSKAGELMGNYAISYKNSRTGRNGGLISAINTIAENFKKDAIKHYIQSVFLESVNPLDFYTKVVFMQEYIDKFGNALTPGEYLMSPYELASNIEGVINQHVSLVNKFRENTQ